MSAYGFKVPVTITFGLMRTTSFLAIAVSISGVIYPMHKASRLNMTDTFRGK